MQPFASVAVTVIGNVPWCVGVPESVPSAASVRPVGSGDAVVYVIAPVPPADVNVWLNGTLIAPDVVAGLVTVIVAVHAGIQYPRTSMR